HVGGTHRLALAAAQTVLDRVRNISDLAALHDERLVAQQIEAGRPGVTQVGTRHELAGIEAALRVDTALVVLEGLQLFLSQKLVLGQADAVFAGNHAVEVARDLHDASHRLVGFLQHAVVIRVDRDVGVYVAVAGMHVQSHKDPALQHAVVYVLDGGQHSGAIGAGIEPLHQGTHFGLPRNTDGVVLYHVENAGVGLLDQALGERIVQRLEADTRERVQRLRQRRIQVLQQPAPALAYAAEGGKCIAGAARQDLLAGVFDVVQVLDLAHGQLAPQDSLDLTKQAQLVARGQLDVDALDVVRVLAHAIQRDH